MLSEGGSDLYLGYKEEFCYDQVCGLGEIQEY